MNPRLKELLETLRAKQAEQDALLAKSELNADEQVRVKSLESELSALEGDIAQAKEFADIEAKAAARRALVTTPVTTLPQPTGGGVPFDPEAKAIGLPADTALGSRGAWPVEGRRRGASLKNFAPREMILSDGTASEVSAEEQAERFGMWLCWKFGQTPQNPEGSRRARSYCEERKVGWEFAPPRVKVALEGVAERGGYIVPPEFEPMLIDLRERYGVFRAYARTEPMSSDSKSIPRRTGHVTVYPVGEGAAITASDMGFDQVTLVARKWAALTKRSTELDEDNAINLADRLIEDIAWGFSKKEDEAGFIGDGTSTYHGITGVTPQILALSATRANIAGLVIAAGNLWSEWLISNFTECLARLPEYANTNRTAWFCSRTFYFSTMLRLILEQGGSPGAEVIAGVRRPMFLGYPVAISQAMPRVEANDTIPVFFGDMDQAVSFGDRRGMTLAVSEHSDFANDLLVIRATERFDINVHDVGNASATPADREPGPLVAIVTAAA